MKIVIEGVNGSGKSTLAQSLAKEFDLPFLHAGPKPLSNEIAIHDSQRQLFATNCIMDRITPISRLCYKFDNSPRHVVELETYLSLMMENTIFIHTMGRGAHEMKEYYTADHLEEIRKNHELIRQNYIDLFNTIPHLDYNFETNSLIEVFDYVRLRNAQLLRFSRSV